MEKRSVIDLFAEKSEKVNDRNNPNTRNGSVSDGSGSHKDGQRQPQSQRVVTPSIEEGGKNPFELMAPEDAKQVTASKVNMNEAIGELSSLWSGNKSVGENYLRYANKKDLKRNKEEDDDMEDEQGGEE